MRRLLFCFVLTSLMPAAFAADEVTIERVHVAEHVHLLYGKGGNIGVSAGPDGVFLIDDQYAPLSDKILAALRQISDQPVRFVVNTHWHGDHTGGNEALGRRGALIVAHDKVRERLTSEQFIKLFDMRSPPQPPAALPVVTFNDRVSFHINGDRLDVLHVPAAHTDGDAIIHFRKADVLHMGDAFFNGMYPFIDLDSGGTIMGMIEAVERGLKHAGPDTRVIPGHGKLTDTAGLEAYHQMLVTICKKVQQLKAAGKSLSQVQAAQPTAAFDDDWGGGFIAPAKFVEFVYSSLP